MLVGFSCGNFASYRQKCIFSLEASTKNEFRDFNVFKTEQGELLKSALIYGANASGKTNFVKAIDFMCRMVIHSTRDDELISENDPFKFAMEAASEPTFFEMAFILGNVQYRYGFELFQNQVHKEWLYKKEKRSVLLFQRDGANWETIKLFGKMKQADSIKKHTRGDSLFITTAAMLNVGLAKDVVKWFDSLIILPALPFRAVGPGPTVRYLEEGDEHKAKILKYLQMADIGIEDFEIQFKEIEQGEDGEDISLKKTVKKRVVDLRTQHPVYDADKKTVKRVKLPFLQYQSAGTIKFFELLGPVLDALEQGKVLVVDEIDSRLHCAIVRFILSLFNSIDNNPRNAQIICSTHDVLLLEENIRRDQIWFVQKNSFGESELYSLNDFKNVRRDDPILKKYLLGVYGAIPFLHRSEING